MYVKAGVLLQPVADLGVLMRRVVVDDQVKIFSWRRGGVDESEEFDPLLVPMTLLAKTDDFAAG